MGNSWFNIRAAELWFYLTVVRPWRVKILRLWWHLIPSVSIRVPWGLSVRQTIDEHNRYRDWLEANVGKQYWTWVWYWESDEDFPHRETLVIRVQKRYRDRLAELRMMLV